MLILQTFIATFCIFLLEATQAHQALRNSRHLDQNQPHQCTLHIIETIWGDGTTSSSFECRILSSIDASEPVLQIRDSPDWLLNALENDEIKSGTDILHFDPSLIIDGDLVIGDSDNVSIEYKQSLDDITNSAAGIAQGQVGQRSALVVHVKGKDASTSTPPHGPNSLADNIFGTSGDHVNLRSQMKACSYGQFDLVPFNGRTSTGVEVTDGVVSIEIPNIIQGADHRILFSSVKSTAYSVLGDLSAQYDHVMFCLPPGTATNWAAFAYVNDNISVYNDDMCNHPTVQMHEIGHNLSLAHSNGPYAGDFYLDTSGVMGFGTLADDLKSCFNGPKTWQLGWFTSRQVSLTSNDYSWSGNIYGTADYDNTDDSDVMLIRLAGSPNIFVSLNRKTGINADTREGGDQVLVHSKEGDPSEYGSSKLLAKLGQGMSYEAVINDQVVPIQVERISSDSKGILNARISIGDQPDTVMIKSSSFGLCLRPENMRIGALIEATECADNDMSQQWTPDENGQFQNAAIDGGCLRKDSSSSAMKLGNCSTGAPSKKHFTNFAYDGFTSTIMWWKNGMKVLTLSADKSTVALKNQSYTNMKLKKRQEWTLVKSAEMKAIISSTFVIQSMKNNLCLEPDKLEEGSKLSMKACSENALQIWKQDEYGQIRNGLNSNFCLARNGENPQSPRITKCSSLPPTMKQSATAFSYNVMDSTLQWKKGGSRAELTVTEQNEVIVAKRMYTSSGLQSQTWFLNKPSSEATR